MSDSVYTEKYVLFLDILGFEAYTTSDEKSEEFARKVLPILNRIRQKPDEYLFDSSMPKSRSKSIWKKLKESIAWEMSQFSDTFVVSTTSLQWLLTFTANTSFTLLQEQLLCRGAITYGKVFHNVSQFIGPAINRAYNLEKSQALYPRVILDDNIANPSDINLFDKVLRGHDGWNYVHIGSVDDTNFIKMHEKAKQNKNNYWKIKSKYAWFENTYFSK